MQMTMAHLTGNRLWGAIVLSAFTVFRSGQSCLIVSNVLYRLSCPYPHSRFGYSIVPGRTAPRIRRLLIWKESIPGTSWISRSHSSIRATAPAVMAEEMQEPVRGENLPPGSAPTTLTPGAVMSGLSLPVRVYPLPEVCETAPVFPS